jgi:photosystem II stability/assembly factor-like uncharacterized protein
MNQVPPEDEPAKAIENLVYAFAGLPGAGLNGRIFAAHSSGLSISDDGGQTWQGAVTSPILSGPVPVLCLDISPSFEYDGTIIAGAPGGVFRSTDGGKTFRVVLLPQPPPTVTALAFSPGFATDETVFAGTMEDGVFVSNDGGERWVAWNFGLIDLNILCLGISPDFTRDETLFAGTETGLFHSTNGGRAWRDLTLPFGFEAVISIALSPDFARDHTLLIGTESQGLWCSTDAGETWGQVGAFKDPINAVLFGPERSLLAVTSAGLWETSRAGAEPVNRLPEVYADREISAVYLPQGYAQGSTLLIGFVDNGIQVVNL